MRFKAAFILIICTLLALFTAGCNSLPTDEYTRHKNEISRINEKYDAEINNQRRILSLIKAENPLLLSSDKYEKRLESARRTAEKLETALLTAKCENAPSSEISFLQARLNIIYRETERLTRLKCTAKIAEETEKRINVLKEQKQAEVENEKKPNRH